jgi:predicted SprT family Zn-dependent metalloprotease
MHDDIRELIATWGAAWGLPHLAAGIDVSFSPRLTRSLGRCRPSVGRITLRAELLHTRHERLAEVLCHEVAHVAVFQLFGPDAKPHGQEWRELVSKVGFQPEIRARRPTEISQPRPQSSRSLPYEHRCPVCQSVRFARRPVGRWRCAECVDAGLGGELVITRH